VATAEQADNRERGPTMRTFIAWSAAHVMPGPERGDQRQIGICEGVGLVKRVQARASDSW
jgi:hypothetical protein